MIIAPMVFLFLLLGSQIQSGKQNVCVLQTNMGPMVFRFFEADAPQTTNQFQKLVREGFYNGKEFYRVVKGHVIQAGGGNAPKLPPEFNKNPHVLGTLGLGRTGDINSGDSEIYICLAPRPHLDGKYTVFGQLIEGYDTLEKISAVEVEEKWTGPDKKVAMHKPVKPVVIKKAWIEQRDISGSARNVPLLKKLVQTYGICAIVAREGAEVVATLRFYPKSLCEFSAGGAAFCLQQFYPAGPGSRAEIRSRPMPTKKFRCSIPYPVSRGNGSGRSSDSAS